MSSSRLYRSIRDKKITGLCGGLAEFFNIDATLIRLVVAIAAVFSAGTVIVIYLVASIIIPKEPRYNDPYNPYGRPPGGHGPYNGPYGNSYNGDYGAKQYPPRGPVNNGPYRSNFEQSAAKNSEIDEMMKEVEKKAMRKEIDELKAKLAELERMNKDKNKGDV